MPNALPWSTSTRRLWSLCEMIQHVCINFSGMYASVQQYLSMFENQVGIVLVSRQQSGQPDKAIAWPELDAKAMDTLATFVAGFAVQECKHLGLHISEQKAGRLQRELTQHQRFTPESIITELRGLKETIVMELATRKLD